MTASNTISEDPDGKLDPRSVVQRERILSSAENLLAVHGYERVRLRDVANSAGVSIGTVQHYFDTRDQLLSATFEWSSRNLAASYAKAAQVDAPPWDRVQALLAHFFGRSDIHERASIWLAYCEAGSRNADMAATINDIIIEEWRRPMRKAISDGVTSCDFTVRVDVEDVVDILMTLIDGSELNFALGNPHCPPERMEKLLLTVAAAALGRELP
jgi:AcrR family transcriptional regulator